MGSDLALIVIQRWSFMSATPTNRLSVAVIIHPLLISPGLGEERLLSFSGEG